MAQSLSTMCLFLAFAILLKSRSHIQSDRTLVQICLTVALMLFHAMHLLHDVFRSNKHLCEFGAVAAHYFLLASGKVMCFVMKSIPKNYYYKSFFISRYILKNSPFVQMVWLWLKLAPFYSKYIASSHCFPFDDSCVWYFKMVRKSMIPDYRYFKGRLIQDTQSSRIHQSLQFRVKM